MELSRILIRDGDPSQIVELREVGGDRFFPIVIGMTEALAIDRRLMGQLPPRPQRLIRAPYPLAQSFTTRRSTHTPHSTPSKSLKNRLTDYRSLIEPLCALQDGGAV